MKSISTNTVGVIGAGRFGTTLACLLSENCNVQIYTRNQDVVDNINLQKNHHNTQIPNNVIATSDLIALIKENSHIIPVVPSASFRSLMRDVADYLRPYHFILHSTKGFDYQENSYGEGTLYTMSEVIKDETPVIRIGALSGPNLSQEIMDGQPAAAVIASEFQEVIHIGRQYLQSPTFRIFPSADVLGVEVAGALKNMIAIGTGMIEGLGLGMNTRALIVTLGLQEMVAFGKAIGAEASTFYGYAGVGDLMATATSKFSRNFTFGQSITDTTINHNNEDLVEGKRTLQLVHNFCKERKIKLPLIDTIYGIVWEEKSPRESLNGLIASL